MGERYRCETCGARHEHITLHPPDKDPLIAGACPRLPTDVIATMGAAPCRWVRDDTPEGDGGE